MKTLILLSLLALMGCGAGFIVEPRPVEYDSVQDNNGSWDTRNTNEPLVTKDDFLDMTGIWHVNGGDITVFVKVFLETSDTTGMLWIGGQMGSLRYYNNFTDNQTLFYSETGPMPMTRNKT